jgi:hypothetical protein
MLNATATRPGRPFAKRLESLAEVFPRLVAALPDDPYFASVEDFWDDDNYAWQPMAKRIDAATKKLDAVSRKRFGCSLTTTVGTFGDFLEMRIFAFDEDRDARGRRRRNEPMPDWGWLRGDEYVPDDGVQLEFRCVDSLLEKVGIPAPCLLATLLPVFPRGRVDEKVGTHRRVLDMAAWMKRARGARKPLGNVRPPSADAVERHRRVVELVDRALPTLRVERHFTSLKDFHDGPVFREPMGNALAWALRQIEKSVPEELRCQVFARVYADQTFDVAYDLVIRDLDDRSNDLRRAHAMPRETSVKLLEKLAIPPRVLEASAIELMRFGRIEDGFGLAVFETDCVAPVS